MNFKLLFRLLGAILLVEAAAMVPSLLIAIGYGEGDAMAFVWAILLLIVIGTPMRLLSKTAQTNLRAREGFLVVSLSWILMSVFGALPFVFSGVIPHFVDALFEAVSGFTTTGASIMTEIDGQPHGILFWRSCPRCPDAPVILCGRNPPARPCRSSFPAWGTRRRSFT